MPPIKECEVKIQKYKNNNSWHFPSNKAKKYLFVELTSLPQLPSSKAYELSILTDDENELFFEVPSHQYIYNIGETQCSLKIGNSIYENLEPGDSLYIKPNLKHKFIKKGKLLVLRIGGRISGDTLYQLSMISDEKLKRIVDDNKPWFN